MVGLGAGYRVRGKDKNMEGERHSMIYAPVCIITLNRYEHLKGLIESLQQNSWAQYTDLYIGLDFPPSEKYEEGYKKIVQYLGGGIHGFQKVHVIKRNRNIGVAKNASLMIEEVLKRFDRFIFFEDDNIVSVDFLEYMDKCLDYFYEDKRVNMIGGYTNTLLENSVDDSEANIFAIHDGNAWGWGTWEENWQRMVKEINREYFEAAVCDIRKLRKIKYKKSLYKLIDYLSTDQEIPFQDSTINIYMQLNDMCKILPTSTKVLNHGWDGTGVNCGVNDSYLAQKMKEDQGSFSLRISSSLMDAKSISENDSIMQKADKYSIDARRWIWLIMFCIFTPKRAKKWRAVWKKMKKRVRGKY